MDRAWVDDVLKALGPRYKTGAPVGEAIELSYRAGKAEFRPSRFVIGGGPVGRELELSVDVRIPKDSDAAGGEALIAAFDSKSASPRGFVRVSDDRVEMKSESGHEGGTVRSLKYRHPAVGAVEAAKQIRAIVESIDIPFTVGIHEPEHLVAKDPLPPHTKAGRPANEPMDLWEYDLDRGLLHSLTAVVDPNDRTLRMVERKLMSKHDVCETVKLAHVAKLMVRRADEGAEIVAVGRDGSEMTLAQGSGNAEFLATLGRLAKKVFIPLVQALVVVLALTSLVACGSSGSSEPDSGFPPGPPFPDGGPPMPPFPDGGPPGPPIPDGGPPGPPMPDGGPGAMFMSVENIFVQNCNGFPFGCHFGQSPTGSLDLKPANAYAALVNVKATSAPSKTRVVPGDVANSFLWQKLNNLQGASEGNPMPQGEGIRWRMLPQPALDTIRNWIQAGAPQ